MDKAGDFESFGTGFDESGEQCQLVRSGYNIWLVLQAVSRAYFDDLN
jgi:hypothetical protein